MWPIRPHPPKFSWDLTLMSPASSHRLGERGFWNGDVARELPASTFRRVRAHATGRAGDVYICHPLLVHRATWPHRGSGPRILAQPAIEYPQPFALHEDSDVCAVERAILRGLDRRDS